MDKTTKEMLEAQLVMADTPEKVAVIRDKLDALKKRDHRS